MITANQLKSIIPLLTPERAELIAVTLSGACPIYGITDKTAFQMFVAQVAHESGGFLHFEENLNYSAEGLIKTFSYFRHHQVLAREVAHQPVKIANIVYDDKNRDPEHKLGNNQPGDGWKFRGSGAIQMTGRGIITRYTSFRNIQMDMNESADNMVEYMRHHIAEAIESACWLFAIEKKLLKLAADGDIINVSRRIAGSLEGIESRQKLYTRAKQYVR